MMGLGSADLDREGLRLPLVRFAAQERRLDDLGRRGVGHLVGIGALHLAATRERRETDRAHDPHAALQFELQ